MTPTATATPAESIVPSATPTVTPTEFIAPSPTPSPTPPPLLDLDSVTAVQAFNYYYPDLPVSLAEWRGNSILLHTPRGQEGYASFLYRAEYDRESVIVQPRELVSDSGEVLPASLMEVGVVEVVDQWRSISTYLQNIYLRGNHLPDTEDRRRVRTAVEREPGKAMLPFLVVPNHNEFVEAVGRAGTFITLPHHDYAETPVSAGTHRQFWITIRIPPNFRTSAVTARFRGDFRLIVDGVERRLPVDLRLYNFELDTLTEHNKALCAYRAVTEMPTEFRDAAVRDLRAHNVNSIVDSTIYVSDYEYLRASGFDSVVNLDGQSSVAEMNYLRSLGFQELWTYTRDEPEYLIDDPNRDNDGWDVFTSRYNLYTSRGFPVATAGMYLESPDWYYWSYPHDWFAMSFRLSWNPTNPVYEYLREVRQDPAAKIARRLGHYSATIGERYNLLTRILYGPWLAVSNLDFGCPYGYAPNIREISPFRQTDWDGVAYPVKYVTRDGALHHYDMLSNQVWDAFGDGGKMFRMVLTAQRLANSRGTAAERSELDALLAPFQELYPTNNRIDTVVFNHNLDELQANLLAYIARFSSVVN